MTLIYRTKEYIRQSFRQFVKYFVVGITTVALDLSTLFWLKEKMHLSPVLAVTLNQIAILSYNFSLNKYWSFNSKGFSHKQTARYLALSGFNYGFSVAVMYFFSARLGFNYLLVRVISIAAVVLWNFILYRHWIYKDPKNAVLVID